MEGKIGLFPPYLNAGSRGAAVRFLQVILLAFGSAVPGLLADGDYTNAPDGKTVLSVKRLQRQLGLRGKDVDGNLGPKTRRFCKEKRFFDFDVVPLEAADKLNGTEWCGPDHEGFLLWPHGPEPVL